MTRKEGGTIRYIRLESWLSILIFVDESDGCSITYLTKKLNLSFSHCCNIVKSLIKLDLCSKTSKDGRSNKIITTLKGKKLVANSRTLIHFIKTKGEEVI